jgi:perosamine synthetase
MKINWNEPKFGEDEIKEVSEVLNAGYVNEGPKTKQLEEELKKYLGVKYVLLTTNATAALFLAIKADAIIRNKEDFEVIVPDLTMIATATSVEWAGGKPILVDVEKERATIDISKIEEKINEKTIAIIPVHILGRSANMDGLMNLASKHNLTIIEDAAGALGSKDQYGRYLGTIGKMGIFSLQSNKIITSGQGGIIVTNDEKYYEALRRLRDFGRFSNKEFIHEKVGYNLKFNDLSAALAVAQFRKIESKKQMLSSQRTLYQNALKDVKEVKFPSYNSEEIPLWIEIIANDRTNLVEFLIKNEISPRECWPAIHINPPYKNQGNDADFPNSSFLSKNALWLPNGSAITSEQINHIGEKIREFYNSSGLNMKKIHEDNRGYIYLIKNLLEDKKEFTFLETKKGFARGGCLHPKDEYLVVVKGRIKLILGEDEIEMKTGESIKIPANKSHAWIALEDSILSEWGVTEEEKKERDLELRKVIDRINEENKRN